MRSPANGVPERFDNPHVNGPPTRVKAIVCRLYWGEKLETVSEYVIITLLSVAVGVFGQTMVGGIFWICNMIIFIGVMTKYARGWVDKFSGVKCANVALRWESTNELTVKLMWHFYLLILSVFFLAPFVAFVWLTRKEDMEGPCESGRESCKGRGLGWRVHDSVDDRSVARTYELLLVTCGLGAIHWLLALWVLVHYIWLLDASKICVDFFAPFTGREVVRVPPLGDDACDLTVVDLVWYVHFSRHRYLTGFLAAKDESCGLPVTWWHRNAQRLWDVWRAGRRGQISLSGEESLKLLEGIRDLGGHLGPLRDGGLGMLRDLLRVREGDAQGSIATPARMIVLELLRKPSVKEAVEGAEAESFQKVQDELNNFIGNLQLGGERDETEEVLQVATDFLKKMGDGGVCKASV